MPGVPARLDGLDARPSTASQFPGYAPKYITWTYTPSLNVTGKLPSNVLRWIHGTSAAFM